MTEPPNVLGEALDPASAHAVNTGIREGFTTTRHLAHATQQALDRKYSDYLIIDADAHHYEYESWREIVKYIEDPVIRHRAEWGLGLGAGNILVNRSASNQPMAGRIVRYTNRSAERSAAPEPREVTLVRRQMDAIGIDYQIVFPTSMLDLGMHPDPNIERNVSWAYSRWFTEEILPHDPRVKTMVYLPFNDPAACMRMVEYFGDKPGVVGFMVTSARYKPVHDNVYMKLYRAIEERDMPLAFHAVLYSQERLFGGMNQFISVHALGFVLYNLVHLTNMVINGIPERFPRLKMVWIESGLAWLPFIMQRLDNEYLMRTSEAPLLKRKPSEYIKDMFFTTQPMEMDNLEALEMTMKMINADTQLLFASDYPHWDFNLPSTIYDLPFLGEQAKRNILGENAARVFRMDRKLAKVLPDFSTEATH